MASAPVVSQTYRLDFQTVYDEQQMTAYRMSYETVYDTKTYTVTYTITSNSNGSDSYSIAAGSVDTGAAVMEANQSCRMDRNGLRSPLWC